MASRPGINCKVYHGEVYLGDATVFPTKSQAFHFPNHEIRISHLSPPSERCPPLSVLHTISPFSVPCKIRANATTRESPLSRLYYSCYNEGKTAVVVLGDREFHMVAMPSKTEKHPCFWCCSVQPGLYSACLAMLNLRCLSIVFDLDETLFVANTMKSFDDRIEALSHRIDAENNPVKVSGMSSELKRYIEDREMLKQYLETDTVMDNGRLVGVQREPVPPLPGSQDTIFRPVIRLQEKGIVLTRINPEIRDTSVFVRLRPAWEELRSYLTAKGRKRFEVFVCTMAERDYALEMWRLLDPEAHLINSKQLLDRVKCVRAGSRKSLQHVFQDGICHPKMAMVIDDRILVWDDMDQPRVHVVPAFAPYYAPQAEIVAAVPILCVARNVACNVRGGFFKEFDENLLRKIFELCYENDVLDLPYAPDVSDYLMSEDAGIQLNNNRDVPMQDTGVTGIEVEKNSNTVENVGDGLKNQNQAKSNRALSDDDMRLNQLSTNNGDLHNEAGSLSLLPSSIFIAVLEEIGRRCASKVEFRAIVGSNKDFHFHFEVLFSSERIGLGMGKTKKEAQLLAAENALQNLASNYVSYIAPNADGMDTELTKLSLERQNGFLEHIVTPALDESSKKELPSVNTTEQQSLSDDPERLPSVISSIKELSAESQNIVFVDQVPASVTLNKGEYYYQVELAGQILGQGVGISKGEAKLQAAEDVLRNLKAASGPLAQQRLSSPRLPVAPTKRPKEGTVQGLQNSH